MTHADIESVIVSSRVRVARNLESNLTFDTGEAGAFDGVAKTLAAKNKDFFATQVKELKPDMAKALFEQHLISKELLANQKNSWIVVRKDNKVCVMLGEEDHIRIQSTHQGMALRLAAEEGKQIADDIASEHKLAFREGFGYLTSCPTNLGCGMRASVMMFLPALSMTGQINGIIGQLRGKRITVRGVYGEGSSASGYMYQISNQACLGMSEQAIIENVEKIALQVAHTEIELQKRILCENHDWVIDQVHRSWGLLTNAYIMTTGEAVDHLAMLKLGACLGIIQFKNNRLLDEWFFTIRPSTLISQDDRATSVNERDKIRAATLGEKLRAARIK
jgi:protein arginine kinase